MSAMARLFLVAFTMFNVPIIVTQEDSEVSVRMPDNETVVVMKINIKNNKTRNVDHGVSMFLSFKCSIGYFRTILLIECPRSQKY